LGAQLSNVRLGQGNYLLDHVGPSFALLVFTETAIATDVQAVVQAWRNKGVPLQVLAVSRTQALCEGADVCLHDTGGAFAQRYGVQVASVTPHACAAYLVRPDQHVCARWLRLDATRLDAALQQALPNGKSH
jgi:3-(3-hydroxy-phenyl)propionate hydroxylase